MLDMKVHVLEMMPDHSVIKTDPRWAPAELVGKIKANASLPPERTFGFGCRHFWSQSCATVGAVSEATIR